MPLLSEYLGALSRSSITVGSISLIGLLGQAEMSLLSENWRVLAHYITMQYGEDRRLQILIDNAGLTRIAIT